MTKDGDGLPEIPPAAGSVPNAPSETPPPPAGSSLPPAKSPVRSKPKPKQSPRKSGVPLVTLTPWQMLGLVAGCALFGAATYYINPIVSYVFFALVPSVALFAFLEAVAHVQNAWGKFSGSAAMFIATLLILIRFGQPSVPATDVVGMVYVDGQPVTKGTIVLLGTSRADIRREITAGSPGRFEFGRVPVVGKVVKLQVEVTEPVAVPSSVREYQLDAVKVIEIKLTAPKVPASDTTKAARPNTEPSITVNVTIHNYREPDKELWSEEIVRRVKEALDYAKFRPKVQASRCLALCIGLNQVSPQLYLSNGILRGAENDARAYSKVALQNGFEAQTLLSGSATVAEVARNILYAAEVLNPGDRFLLTFAGPGASVADQDSDEPDGRDEAWCLYDGLLRDDHLFHLFSKFKDGVRLLVVCDTSYGSTLTRVSQTASEIISDIDSAKSRLKGVVADNNVLIAVRSAAQDLPKSQRDVALFRSMPSNSESPRLLQNLHNYDRYFESVTLEMISAPGIILSSAGDAQLAMDVGTNGLFTQVLLQVLEENKPNSYLKLFNAIEKRMPSWQQPRMTVFGKENHRIESERPFDTCAE